MKPTLKLTTELALVRSISTFKDNAMKPGRLKNLYSQLVFEVDKALKALPKLGYLDMGECYAKLQAFGNETGWDFSEKHAGTLVSFCLGMIEDSDFKYSPKIIDLLVNILDYYERVGKAPAACCWAGGLAAEKWRAIITAE